MRHKKFAVPLLLASLAASPATQPSTRPAVVLSADSKALVQATIAYDAALPSDALLRDPAWREKNAPTVVPLGTRLFDHYQTVATQAGRMASLYDLYKVRVLAQLIVLGDTTRLTKEPKLSERARTVADFITADEKHQTELVSFVDKELKSNVKDNDAAMMLASFQIEAKVASPPVTAQIKKAADDHRLEIMRQHTDLAESVKNKPMTITGFTPEGKAFTSADWKGKVILVDFWATWCVPCKASLPHVKETYKKYHEQGLEVLQISSDSSKDDLLKFVKADPEMPWPQLFDEKAAATKQFNSLCKKYGIESIPAVFLIDRNGICRSVTGKADMDADIPRLLAEPVRLSSLSPLQ